MRTRAIHGEAVEVDAERRQMQVKILQVDPRSETLSRFFLNEVDEIGMSTGAIHEERKNRGTKQNWKMITTAIHLAVRSRGRLNDRCGWISRGSKSPEDRWMIVTGNSSECLADADEVLRWVHSRDGIQILSEVDAQGPTGC